MKTILLSTLILTIILNFNYYAVSQEIWGMTKYGGANNKGVIFKMDEDASNQEVVYSFEETGVPEGSMTEYGEGVFYGMTNGGGKYGFGMIYRYNVAEGGFTKVLDLNGEETGRNGVGNLLLAQNGKMYGMTVHGGIYDLGILFEFDPVTYAFLKLHDFDGSNTGSVPFGSLTEISDGIIYGMTSLGGENEEGVIFKFEPPAGELTKILDFNGADTGANPMGSLTLSTDGKLYGMTRWGGAYDHGVLFSLIPGSDEFTALFEFNGEVTGRNPHGSLIEATDGKLYGTTPFGGTYNKGVIFDFDHSTNTFTIRYEFTGHYGLHSYGSLTQVSNGSMYGIISRELFPVALMFEFNPTQDTIMEIDYHQAGLRGYEGSTESLTAASNGKYYFWGRETYYVENDLFLFEFDPEENAIVRHQNRSKVYAGGLPHGNLVQAANGNFYGLTSKGGEYDLGVLFEFNPVTKAYKKIIDFDGAVKGAIPKGSLILADNNRLYGMTSKGGELDKGVLFEYDPLTETYTKLVDFNGEEKGEQPVGSLVEASNNYLYGMTPYGGSYNYGVIFEFNAGEGSFNKLIDFDGVENGREPNGSLIQASDGYLYGSSGKLFKVDPISGSLNIFPGTSANATHLMQASNQKIYGSGNGVFEYNPVDNSFEQIAGGSIGHKGKLFEVSENMLLGMDYGWIEVQGIEDRGSIFEIDLLNDNSITILEFNGSNGSNPDNSGLVRRNDTSGPVALCKNVTLYLDETGETLLEAVDVNDGSTGEGLQLSLSESGFNCNDMGENSVVLTATDAGGRSVTCSAVITVADDIPPVAVCKDIEVYLDSDGNAAVEVADVDNGSNDACGLESSSFDVSTFTCANTGENLVEMTVTDSNGNISTCTSTVTVIDSVAPVALCRDVEVNLDAEGNAGIEVADLDNGSSDACGIRSTALNVTNFTCENVGENPVELTVTDVNGNSSTCLTVVSVMDNLAPHITCTSSLSSTLDPFEEKFLIEDTGLNAEAEDNCGIESLDYFINGNENTGATSLAGVELEAGAHEIQWVAADGAGNFATCITTISIERRPTSLLITENKIDHELGEIHVAALLIDKILAQGIEGKMVKLSVNNDSASLVTDERGVVKFKVPLGDELQNVYSLSTWFEEDGTYAACKSESDIVTEALTISAAVLKVYPNPFSEKLYIEFVANQSTDARIDLYDSSGRMVTTIFNQPVETSMYYKAEFSPSESNNSFFLYRLKIGNAIQTGKVIYGQ